MTSPLPGATADTPSGSPPDIPTGTPYVPARELVPALAIAPRTVVVDEITARVGEIMGSEGPYLQLRPLGGGREWDADPARVRPTSAEERLRASVAAVNARNRHTPRGPG